MAQNVSRLWIDETCSGTWLLFPLISLDDDAGISRQLIIYFSVSNLDSICPTALEKFSSKHDILDYFYLQDHKVFLLLPLE